MILYTKALLRNALPKKTALGLLLAAGSIANAFADNKIYVSESLNLKPGDQAEVVVRMEVDQTSYATQMDIKLPAGLTIKEKGEYDEEFDEWTYTKFNLNNAAVSNGYSISPIYKENGIIQIAIASTSGNPIALDGDKLFSFTVEATEELANESQIEFSNAKTANEQGTSTWTMETTNATVVKVVPQPGDGVVMSADNFSIDASETYTVTVDVENGDQKLYLGQVSVKLPEGLTMVGADNSWATATNRVSSRQTLQCTKDGDVYTAVLVHNDTSKPGYLLNNKGHNHFFTFQVKADTLLAAESVINLINIAFSDADANSIDLDDVEITVTSPNAAAKPAADAAVKAVFDALAGVVIADEVKENPLVVADKAAAEAAAAAVPEAVKEGFMAGELDSDPTPYADEVEAANAAIAQLQKTADEAKAKFDADAIVDQLNAAKAAEVVPDSVEEDPKVDAAVKAAEKAIEDLDKFIDDTYGDGRTGSLADKAAEVEEMKAAAEEAIAKIAPAVENAQVYQKMAPLAAGLDDIINEAEEYIQTNDPKVASQFADQIADLRERAADLQQMIADKYDAIELTKDDEFTLGQPIVAITQAAEQLKNAADAAAEAAAKAVVDKAVEEAQQAVDHAEELVLVGDVNDYPAVEEALKKAQGMLDDLKAAAQEPFKGKDDSLRTVADEVIAAAEAVEPILREAEAVEAAAKADAQSKENSINEALQDVKDKLAESTGEALSAAAAALEQEVADELRAAEKAAKTLSDLVENTKDGDFWKFQEEVAEDSTVAADAIQTLEDAIAQTISDLSAAALDEANAALQQLKEDNAAADADVDSAVKEHPFVKEAEAAADEAVKAVEDFINANKDSLAFAGPAAELAELIAAAEQANADIAVANDAALADKAVNDAALAELQEQLAQAKAKIDDIALILNGTPQVKEEFQEKFDSLKNAADELGEELKAKCDAFELSNDSVKAAEEAEIASLKDKAVALLEEASAAEKAYQDNENAKVRLDAEMGQVQAALDAAKAAIAALEDVKGDFDDETAALQDAIDGVNAQVAADYAERRLNNESTVPADSLKQEIAALVDAAKAAQDSVNQVKAENYAALDTRLKELRTALNELNKEIATLAAPVKEAVAADQTDLGDMVSDITRDIEDKKARLNDSTVVNALEAELDALEEGIEALDAKADSLQAAYEAEMAAQQVARDAAQAAVAAAAELKAPEAGEDNRFFEEANQKVLDAERAIAAAQGEAENLQKLVEADAATMNVVGDSAAINEAIANAADALEAAQKAIEEADSALEAAAEAYAEELAKEQLADEHYADLVEMVEALEAPEAGEDNKFFEEANQKVAEAQAAIEAAQASADACGAALAEKKEALSVVEDSAELKALAMQAVADVQAAKAAIDEANTALEEAQAAYDEELVAQTKGDEHMADLQEMVDALEAPEKGEDNKFFTEANEKVDEAAAAVEAAQQAAADCASALADKKDSLDVLADSAELKALAMQAVADVQAAQAAIEAANAALEEANKAYESEKAAETLIGAIVWKTLENVAALEAPEKGEDNEFFAEANQKVAEAEAAIEEAKQAVQAFVEKVADDIQNLSVLEDNVAIQAAADLVDEKMAAAKQAIKAAQDAIDEANKALEEAAAREAALNALDSLNDRIDDLDYTIPERVASDSAVVANQALTDAAIAAAQEALSAAAEAIDTAAAVKDNADVADAIEAAENAVAAAEAAKAVLDAAVEEAMQGETEEQAASNAKYAELSEVLTGLRNDLNEAKTHIENEDADVAPEFRSVADSIENLLNMAKDELEKAKAAYSLKEGSDLTPAAADLAQGIADMVAAADAAQAAYDNAAAEAALNDKLDDAKDDLDELKDKRDDLLENNEFMNEDDLEEIDQQIADIEQEIAAIEQEIADQAAAGNLADDAVAGAIDQRIDDLEDAIQAVDTNIEDAQVDYDEHHKVGDVDADTEVDVVDYMRLLGYLKNPSTIPTEESNPELFARLDVNGDKRISISDAAAIINVIFYGTPTGDASARVMSTGEETVSAETSVVNGRQRLALGLKSSRAFVGYQFDVVLPEGMKIAGVQLTDRMSGHDVTVADQGNGKATVYVSSATNEEISGTEGTLLYIDLEGSGKAQLENIEFADAAAQAHLFTIAGAETTGIASVKAAAEGEQVYGIGGRMMNALKKGINIIRRTDGTTQKVIK